MPPVLFVSHLPYHLFAGGCDCSQLHERRALPLQVRSSGRPGNAEEAAGQFAGLANRSAQSDSLVFRGQHLVPLSIFGSFYCRWQQPKLLDRRLSYPTWKCPSDCSCDIFSNPRIAFGELTACWAPMNSIGLSPAIRKDKSLKAATGYFPTRKRKRGSPLATPLHAETKPVQVGSNPFKNHCRAFGVGVTNGFDRRIFITVHESPRTGHVRKLQQNDAGGCP